MEARSNWTVESVVELQDAIQESTQFPSEDLAELLDEEKCFSLTRPDDIEDWCCIKLGGNASSKPWPVTNSSKLIKGILLHSEARVVEVCVGGHDEYLKTVHGRRLGQYEDTEMCACEIQLDSPRREVLLRFKHTYNLDCVWVFGLHVVTEEQAMCKESRFGGGHISSVLKEKDVSVSKDAARFLSMLESYNAMSNGNSPQVNENNQMALMSMFLGPKMLSNASFTPAMLEKVNGKGENGDAMKKSKINAEKKDSSCEVKKNVEVTDLDEANCNVESKMKELTIGSEEGNINNKATSEGNNNTSGNQCSESIEPKPQTTAGNNDGLVEKLFTFMGNFNHIQEQRSGRKAEASPPPHSAPDCLTPPVASSQRHTMHTLIQSLNTIPTPVNFHPSQSSAPGPAHSTPRAQESGDGSVWPGDGGCEGLALETSGLLLKEIENMIDRKFAQMEERLVRRVEQKVAEKAESDSKRLEKIEEHLSQLCERLQR